VGTISLAWEVLRAGDGSTRLIVHQAPAGSPDHAALSLLAIAADAAR
jgi:hypothetical protein